MPYDPLTVAEQTAFEFGSRLAGLADRDLHSISRIYAHSHAFALFPRGEYEASRRRLLLAFQEGARIAPAMEAKR